MVLGDLDGVVCLQDCDLFALSDALDVWLTRHGLIESSNLSLS